MIIFHGNRTSLDLREEVSLDLWKNSLKVINPLISNNTFLTSEIRTTSLKLMGGPLLECSTVEIKCVTYCGDLWELSMHSYQSL